MMTLQHIAGALRDVAEALSSAGDSDRAGQARELMGKLTDGRLTVALCGHFSAGKSTLVNTLCGAELLPSSPIPTSANVVSIRGGERAFASVETIRDGKTVRAEIPIGELDRYCVDGEQFLSVSIVYPSALLGRHVVLLDTPGIDSTDDAHRMATESALHLADVVFYVMDYNHVQSEINFAFAKSLKDWGKPLYFIVNQIDKHRERELSFQAYRDSVADAFHAWHLEPAGIVYLSLRQPHNPNHEWEALIGLIGALAERRETLCAYSVDASVRHLLASHLKERREREEPERTRLLEEAGGEEGVRRAAGQINRLTQSLAELAAEREVYRAELRRELQGVLDNANITPASLRDLAHWFLESRKPGFRTGLLFAGAKTAAEQEKRLEAFRVELASLVDAGIDWHVKQLLRKAGETIGFDGGKLEEAMKARLGWQPDGAWLLARVKAGAVFGNEYTMTYSRELAADVKSEYRGRAVEIIDALTAHAALASEERADAIRRELREAEEMAGAARELEALERQAADYGARLEALLPPAATAPDLPAPQRLPQTLRASGGTVGASAVRGHSAAATEQRPSADARAGDGRAATAPAPWNFAVGGEGAGAADGKAAAPAAARGGFAGSGGGAALALQRGAALRLGSAAELLEPHSALRASAAAMRDKAERLQRSTFTIALFGAFSAGKSSLANALIGEAVLPVSPNPTTAAINRLMPPNERFGHGTARIVMKSREAMLADLRYSLSLLGEDASEEALKDAGAIMRLVDRITPDSVGAGGRAHYSFLRAARAGWERHEPLLGEELRADRQEYASYVADESRSCFVSEIDFHYDCALTAEGIVLVDTPGADSVNARHTGVAFNYIKNADAVLFVTYYNHAFSQADRQFLDQLGRVKDQFELDKMFFIVNASDLAASAEELQDVLRHVESNLQQHAIRSPRLFPVSSIMALDGKADGNAELIAESGIESFESAFLSFVQHDLGRLAVQSAEAELQRALSLVAGWIRGAEGDASTRRAELERLNRAVEKVAEPVRELGGGALPEGLGQELRELLYYVVQRLQFRLGDFYHLAFNPASLQDDGRDLRRAVWTSWLELQRLLQRELSQELLATTLRLEKALYGYLRKAHARAGEAIAAAMAEYEAAPCAARPIDVPEQPKDWEERGVEAKWLWSRFKSPRQFFEGEGKAALRKELEAVVVPSLQGWSESVAAAWLTHYERAWRDAAAFAAAALERDATSYAEGKRDSLTDSSRLNLLKDLHERLIHL